MPLGKAHAYSENKMEEIKDAFYKSVKYLSLIGGLLLVIADRKKKQDD